MSLYTSHQINAYIDYGSSNQERESLQTIKRYWTLILKFAIILIIHTVFSFVNDLLI